MPDRHDYNDVPAAHAGNNSAYFIRVMQTEAEHLHSCTDALRRVLVDAGSDLLDSNNGCQASERQKLLINLKELCGNVDHKSIQLNSCNDGLCDMGSYVYKGEDPPNSTTYETVFRQTYANSLSKDYPKSSEQAKTDQLVRDIDSALSPRDNELLVLKGLQSTTCPVTGQEMTNPVINIYCNHRYDLEGVKALISQRLQEARCPVTGCDNPHPLVLSDLREDMVLKREMDN